MRTVNGEATRLRSSAVGLAVLVAVVSLLVTATAGALVAGSQREVARKQLERRTALVAGAVASESARYVDSLRTVATAVGAFDRLTGAKFTTTTAPLAEMRLAGAASIAFLVPVEDHTLAATQAFWRAHGASGLVLRAPRTGREHIFSIFSRPLDPGTRHRTGVDATQAAAPARALTESRRTGEVAISDTYQLIIDREVPAARRQLSFVMSAPVYATVAGKRTFRGWVIMGLRAQSFVGGTLAQISQNLLDVTLHAANSDGTSTAVAALRSSRAGERDLSRTVEVTVVDRRWRLRVEVEGRRLPGASTALPGVVGAAGAVLSLLLAGLIYTLASGRARARGQVRSATADLATAEAAARRQADLLASILDGISDGVAVVDTEGAFLLYNPAARAIVGQEGDVNGPDRWQEHFGLFAPDGVTPFPTERVPLVRALAGESSEQVEMVIRNEANPEGITVTVSGRPLRTPDGLHGAVAVFHDISGRKAAEARLAATVATLSEREADLRAFAAVTAHDLKAPLASVAGYADLLGQDLCGTADPTDLRPTVTRILTGIQRMRRLIDDILAYATARDRHLQFDDIDLRTLVAEVITERTAHLCALGGADGPAPEIYTGPLPVVRSDPSMIRQLLDNIIGNSLKYAVPGQPARVDISARPTEPDGWVRIEIADRGVGIPVADQPHVFDSFHRAADHAAYTGTGLGLAICKRIVERHGGTLGVSDNPGGGTRIFFTLPVPPDTVEDPAEDTAPVLPGVLAETRRQRDSLIA